jgi:DNA repair photolyase
MKIFPLGELKFDEQELKTDLGKGNFIFVGSSCDMVAKEIPRKWIEIALEHCRKFDNKYLFQSKNPNGILAVKDLLPKNSVIGTTIETNRDELYVGISKAPLPSQRFEAMLRLQHSRKIVTIEPVLDFDVEIMVKWVRSVGPEVCYVGCDSKRNYLPEPELRKVKVLMKKLKESIDVRAKTMRKAWWEDRESP